MRFLRGLGSTLVACLLGWLCSTGFADDESAKTASVRIAGEVVFRKTAPIFLRLIALDAAKQEVVVRERIIDLTADDVARGHIRFEFAELKPGRYALKAFQDMNGNKKIDIGMFGPKEPWSTYRLARPKFRPPRFDEMAFDASADVLNADLVMR
ncbi:MAG: DUF2141 domain-containing protein [Vicinamibacteria bacterium]|nr:DUF2141 domain-containing protein [Vicinamibacteria bacterium]